MGDEKNSTGVATDIVVQFLRRLMPFRGVPIESLRELARGAMLAFYPDNEVILKQGVDEPHYLFLVERGAVRVYQDVAEAVPVLVDYRGEGSSFGVSQLVKSSKSPWTVQAAEDTFCYLLRKEAFVEFAQTNPLFLQNYFQAFSQELLGKAYSEWHFETLQAKADHGLYLHGATVGEMPLAPAEKIDESLPVHLAAAFMARHDLSLVLVCDHAGNVVGLFGDKHIRERVAAKRDDYDQPVRDFMDSPVFTISHKISCSDAISEMMRRNTQYLLVERESGIAGLVAQRDLSLFHTVSPFDLLGEIDAQMRVEDLHGISNRIPEVVASLLEVGAKANAIAGIISVLNEHLVGRILTLVVEEIGPPPVEFCWVVMGSEGREEQTFRTDQDNGLLYEDPGEDRRLMQSCLLYFRNLGNRVVDHLVKCGFPLCKGEFMASKSTWRKPYSVWSDYFDYWISASGDEDTLHAKIFFDFRSGIGNRTLADRLRNCVADKARRHPTFIRQLARDSLNIKPPLSFFRNFIVEGDGEHKDRLDLKMRGLVPIVDFARVLTLKHGLRTTNTANRLSSLAEAGHLPARLGGDILEAYELLMQVRLVNQMRLIGQGLEPHNFVDPAELSDLEKHTLKGAFGVISEMQSYMAKIRSSL
ncbi:MAG: putative nucleotidyltransferase substrate binding domain-containing protein [Thermodesulfobacteriota bacterium]